MKKSFVIKNIPTLEFTPVKCRIKTFEVQGSTTFFEEVVVVNDEKKVVKRRYKHPRVVLNFKATVDIRLSKNALYTDGANMFLAIERDTIINAENHVDSFYIPVKLACVSELFYGTKL